MKRIFFRGAVCLTLGGFLGGCGKVGALHPTAADGYPHDYPSETPHGEGSQ